MSSLPHPVISSLYPFTEIKSSFQIEKLQPLVPFRLLFLLLKSLDKNKKTDLIEDIALKNVDIKALGMYTLGDIRKTLDADTIDKYNKLFEKYFLKSLISKYNPITFIKWFYFFGLIFVIPFGFEEFSEISWVSMPVSIYLRVGFVILFTTCITYLFNLYGLSKLKPTTVSVFIYLQPVIATIFALSVGSDSLNITKILATTVIFFGVYLVTKQPKNSAK